jgi:hypothetical protein
MTARRVGALALIAVLQMLLIALLYWPRVSEESTAASTALLAPDLVPTRILIEDETGARVSLRREAEAWLLDEGALPAARSQVESLLEALSATPGFPVANTAAARERFAVDEANFRRRITLSGDSSGDTRVIFLGTSPGMGRSHARREDAQAILPVSLSIHDVPAQADGWLNPNLLALPAVDALSIGEQRWDYRDGVWQPGSGSKAPADEIPEESLGALKRALASLQVSGLAEAPADPAGADRRLLPLDFAVSQAGETMTLRLLSANDGQPPRLYSSARGRWFSISRYDHDRLRDALVGVRSGTGSNGTRSRT